MSAAWRTNDGPDPEKLERKQNARTHGVHADPANVLNDLADRDPDAYEWVMSKYDSYLDASPFDDGSAKADLLKQIATQEYTIWKATGHQLRNGVVRQTDDGREESPVNLPLGRMHRTVTRRLERLGQWIMTIQIAAILNERFPKFCPKKRLA